MKARVADFQRRSGQSLGVIGNVRILSRSNGPLASRSTVASHNPDVPDLVSATPPSAVDRQRSAAAYDQLDQPSEEPSCSGFILLSPTARGLIADLQSPTDLAVV